MLSSDCMGSLFLRTLPAFWTSGRLTWRAGGSTAGPSFARSNKPRPIGQGLFTTSGVPEDITCIEGGTEGGPWHKA